MKRLIYLVALVFLAGCGSEGYVELQTDIYDAELAKYRDQFYAVAEKNGRDLSGSLVTLTAGVVRQDDGQSAAGVCVKSFPLASVTVDVNLWPKFSDTQKRGLVFHELAHCLLGRDHNDERMSELGCPKSLMATTLPIQSCLFLHQDEYDAELFETP